jgi:hypothetical protein
VKLPYKYTVDNAVLHLFAAAPKQQREQLLRIFDFLSREPFTNGDHTQADPTGRRCQVKRFGPWTITYWPEHLANEIHILDVERLI